MEPILVVAVAVVAAVSALNLLLVLTVVRRLGDHAQRLAELDAQPSSLSALPAGTPVPAFRAEPVDGDPVDQAYLAEAPALVAFVASDCPSCREQLRSIIEYGEHLRATGGRLVVVVVAGERDCDDMVERVRAAALVIVDPPEAPLANSFGVSVFPTLYLVRDGVLTTAAHSTRRLPGLVPA